MHSVNRQKTWSWLPCLGVLLLTAGPAQAVCSTFWIGGVDSNFTTPGNWSTLTVPGADDDVCITSTTATDPVAVADTYTVIVDAAFSSQPIHSLTLGGASGTQTLVIPAANIQLIIAADSAVTAHGVLAVGDSSNLGYSVLQCFGDLVNGGELKTVGGEGGNTYLRLNIVNAAGGHVDIGTATNVDTATAINNDGTVTVAAEGSLAFDGGSFTNGGTISNGGVISLNGGTFTQRGTEAGTVLLNSSILDDDLGAGSGGFHFTGGGTLTGTGSSPGVPAGQVVSLAASDAFLSLGVSLTNNGTISLGDLSGGYAVLQGPGDLLNRGALGSNENGGAAYLRVNIINDPSATIDLDTVTYQDTATTITNSGTVTIGTAGTLALGGSATFFNNGGTVANNGAFSVSSGTFTQRGTNLGNQVLLSGSTLDDDLDAGAGLFNLTEGGILTGSGSKPGVAASQVVTVSDSDNALVLGSNLTNAGTLTLDGIGGYLVLQGPGDLINSGQLNTLADLSGSIYLRVNISNTAGGVIDIGALTNQDFSTTTSNGGTLRVEAGSSLALSGGAAFSQDACATFATTIDANAASFGQLTLSNAQVSLDGTLMVTTVGMPASDGTWPIISGADLSGQFSALQLVGSNNYDLQYTTAGLTLVVLAEAPPTPTAPTPPTVCNRTPAPTTTHTIVPADTGTPTVAPTLAPTLIATQTTVPTVTPIPTIAPTRTPTLTPIRTATSTAAPTSVPTATQTFLPTASHTVTAT